MSGGVSGLVDMREQGEGGMDAEEGGRGVSESVSRQ
jgi:hypothetical protein